MNKSTYQTKQKRHHQRKTRAYNYVKLMALKAGMTVDEWLDRMEGKL